MGQTISEHNLTAAHVPFETLFSLPTAQLFERKSGLNQLMTDPIGLSNDELFTKPNYLTLSENRNGSMISSEVKAL